MPIKSELLEKLADYIDVPADIETEEDIKSYFDKTFGRRDTIKTELRQDSGFVNELIGKKVGKLENKLKNFAKEMGAAGYEDWKDKIGEELFEIALDKTKSTLTQKIKTLEEKASSGAPEGFEEEKKTLLKDKEFYENKYKTLGQEFEEFKTNIVKTQRAEKLNKGVEGVFSSIPFPKEADKFKIKGFKSEVLETVQFDLDDQENLVVKDKSGNPISNPNKAGSWYSPEEYVKELAVKEKLFQINPDGGKPAPQGGYGQQQFREAEPTTVVKPMNPRAAV